MKIKRHMMFMEGEQDSSGGAGYALAHMDNGEASGAATASGEASGAASGAAAPVTAPATATIDPKAFAMEFGTVLAQHSQAQQARQPQAPLTPEQIAQAQKELNFWDPDDTFLKEFGDIATQKQALLKMRDGMGKQFITIVNKMLQERDQQYQGQLAPLRQMQEERALQERESRFHVKYPALADSKLQPMVQGAIAHLNNLKAFENKTEDQAFELLGKFIEDGFRVHNPQFSLGAPAPAGTRSTNSIPVTSSGSGGTGSNGGSSSAVPKNWALRHMK